MKMISKKNIIVLLLPFWILLGWALSGNKTKEFSALKVFSGGLVLTSVATYFYHQSSSRDKPTGKIFKTKSGETIEEYEKEYSPAIEMDYLTKRIITVQFIVGIIIFFTTK